MSVYRAASPIRKHRCVAKAGHWSMVMSIDPVSGAQGELYESIREQGFHISMGEREAEVASVAAPIFGLNWRLLGSICISGPSARLQKPKLMKHAKSVIRAANLLSYALAGSKSAQTPRAISRWHP